MVIVLRLLLALCIVLSIAMVRPRTTGAAPAPGLSALDRAVGIRATELAGRSPAVAARWLNSHHKVSAAVGKDGHTVEVRFGDGARLVILPAEQVQDGVPRRPVLMRLARASAASARALVLEPFADELGRGADAGGQEIRLLASAGFRVDSMRNSQVTVHTLETMADYSAIYIETHSGILANGDAVIATGEADAAPYGALYGEHSLVQVTVAGDPHGTLYNAITGTFVSLHLGRFPDSSIVFLNGCSVLRAPSFWAALQGHNVASLLSWDNEANAAITDGAAQVVVSAMVSGASVQAGIAAARQAGLGTSLGPDGVAHLGYLGDGSNTLLRAEGTPMPTSAPTSVPSPTPARTTPTKTKQKCKRGRHLVKGKCRRRHGGSM